MWRKCIFFQRCLVKLDSEKKTQLGKLEEELRPFLHNTFTNLAAGDCAADLGCGNCPTRIYTVPSSRVIETMLTQYGLLSFFGKLI